MPHTITIEEKVVIGKYWGKVTLDDIRRAKEEIPQMKGFTPTLPQIIDLGHADLEQLTLASVEGLMKESSIASPLALQVIVLPSDSMMEAAKRIQQMAPSTGRTILITRSLSEARATLTALSRKRKHNR